MVVVARDDDIQIERLETKPFGTNAYVITCGQTRDSVLIDAPAEAGAILELLKATNPKYILLTHNHMDHLGALSELHSRLKVPIAAHALDSDNLHPAPETLLNDGDVVLLGKVKIEVLHTPGHTPGSLCFRIGKYLLAGDTIFPGGPGRTRAPADLSQIIKSITEKIFVLPDETEIYPGHGDSTTLKKERDKFATFSSRTHDPNLCGDVLWLSS